MLGDFLGVGAEIGFEGTVLQFVGATRACAGDRTVLDVAAVNPDEEFGRRADNVTERRGIRG
jgi:hypothetical protein